MNKIKLDSRLSSVASLVRDGSVVADIGTDHAYLLCYLIQNGISPRGIAADIGKGPLENAKKTVTDFELCNEVKLILSDGLRSLPDNCADDIVIAGMGGILISEILSAVDWIKNKNIRIIAQPMTHAETLRKFLVTNGFEIFEEKTATDGKRFYCTVAASYSGKADKKDVSYYYLGELLKNRDEITKDYLDKMLRSMEKKLSALKKAKPEESTELQELITEIKKKISEAYYD
ncbi:MAG: SAM-dependent methyltransferase [Clostridia bacterium]|nr:SAM-dependent methyltransferase [Clostridia bacterium]